MHGNLEAYGLVKVFKDGELIRCEKNKLHKYLINSMLYHTFYKDPQFSGILNDVRNMYLAYSQEKIDLKNKTTTTSEGFSDYDYNIFNVNAIEIDNISKMKCIASFQCENKTIYSIGLSESTYNNIASQVVLTEPINVYEKSLITVEYELGIKY